MASRFGVLPCKVIKMLSAGQLDPLEKDSFMAVLAPDLPTIELYMRTQSCGHVALLYSKKNLFVVYKYKQLICQKKLSRKIYKPAVSWYHQLDNHVMHFPPEAYNRMRKIWQHNFLFIQSILTDVCLDDNYVEINAQVTPDILMQMLKGKPYIIVPNKNGFQFLSLGKKPGSVSEMSVEYELDSEKNESLILIYKIRNNFDLKHFHLKRSGSFFGSSSKPSYVFHSDLRLISLKEYFASPLISVLKKVNNSGSKDSTVKPYEEKTGIIVLLCQLNQLVWPINEGSIEKFKHDVEKVQDYILYSKSNCSTNIDEVELLIFKLIPLFIDIICFGTITFSMKSFQQIGNRNAYKEGYLKQLISAKSTANGIIIVIARNYSPGCKQIIKALGVHFHSQGICSYSLKLLDALLEIEAFVYLLFNSDIFFEIQKFYALLFYKRYHFEEFRPTSSCIPSPSIVSPSLETSFLRNDSKGVATRDKSLPLSSQKYGVSPKPKDTSHVSNNGSFKVVLDPLPYTIQKVARSFENEAKVESAVTKNKLATNNMIFTHIGQSFAMSDIGLLGIFYNSEFSLDENTSDEDLNASTKDDHIDTFSIHDSPFRYQRVSMHLSHVFVNESVENLRCQFKICEKCSNDAYFDVLINLLSFIIRIHLMISLPAKCTHLEIEWSLFFSKCSLNHIFSEVMYLKTQQYSCKTVVLHNLLFLYYHSVQNVINCYHATKKLTPTVFSGVGAVARVKNRLSMIQQDIAQVKSTGASYKDNRLKSLKKEQVYMLEVLNSMLYYLPQFTPIIFVEVITLCLKEINLIVKDLLNDVEESSSQNLLSPLNQYLISLVIGNIHKCSMLSLGYAFKYASIYLLLIDGPMAKLTKCFWKFCFVNPPPEAEIWGKSNISHHHQIENAINSVHRRDFYRLQLIQFFHRILGLVNCENIVRNSLKPEFSDDVVQILLKVGCIDSKCEANDIFQTFSPEELQFKVIYGVSNSSICFDLKNWVYTSSKSKSIDNLKLSGIAAGLNLLKAVYTTNMVNSRENWLSHIQFHFNSFLEVYLPGTECQISDKLISSHMICLFSLISRTDEDMGLTSIDFKFRILEFLVVELFQNSKFKNDYYDSLQDGSEDGLLCLEYLKIDTDINLNVMLHELLWSVDLPQKQLHKHVTPISIPQLNLGSLTEGSTNKINDPSWLDIQNRHSVKNSMGLSFKNSGSSAFMTELKVENLDMKAKISPLGLNKKAFSCLSLTTTPKINTSKLIYKAENTQILSVVVVLMLLVNNKVELNENYITRAATSNEFRCLNIVDELYLFFDTPIFLKLLPSLVQQYLFLLPSGSWIILKLLCRHLFNENLYEKKEYQGKGAFGIIYKCDFSSRNLKSVAVKILDISSISSKKMTILYDAFYEISILYFLRDIKAAVQIIDYGLGDEGIYIVMVHSPCNLNEWRESLFEQSSLSYLEKILIVFKLFMKICAGLIDIHEAGVAHFDIKSENIMMRKRFEEGIEDIQDDTIPYEEVFFFTDFGESQILKSENSEFVHCNRSRGTECIKSPEMLKSENQTDKSDNVIVCYKSDIWSMGCLLYEIFSGNYLFQNENWAELFSLLTKSEDNILSSIRLSKLIDAIFPKDKKEICNSLEYRLVVDTIEVLLTRDQTRRPTLASVITRLESIVTQLSVSCGQGMQASVPQQSKQPTGCSFDMDSLREYIVLNQRTFINPTSSRDNGNDPKYSFYSDGLRYCVVKDQVSLGVVDALTCRKNSSRLSNDTIAKLWQDNFDHVIYICESSNGMDNEVMSHDVDIMIVDVLLLTYHGEYSSRNKNWVKFLLSSYNEIRPSIQKTLYSKGKVGIFCSSLEIASVSTILAFMILIKEYKINYGKAITFCGQKLGQYFGVNSLAPALVKNR